MRPFQGMWVQVDSTWCCVFPNQGARCSPVRAHIFVGRADCHINVTNSSPQGYNYTSCSHCYTFSPHCNKPSTCRWLFYHLPALHVEPFAGPDLQVHDSLTHDNSFFFSFFFFTLTRKDLHEPLFEMQVINYWWWSAREPAADYWITSLQSEVTWKES